MGATYALNKNKYLLEPELTALQDTTSKAISSETGKTAVSSETRNALIIQLGLATGARATELLNITKADVNMHDKTIFIRGIKNSNDREIPITDTLFTGIQSYVSSIQSDRLFNISYERLVQVWDMYRPVKKKFHCLRHTFAIMLYKRTKDLRLVQVALGHRNITNTMIYADYVYSQSELKKLIL